MRRRWRRRRRVRRGRRRIRRKRRMRMKIGGGGNEAGAMYHLIATAKGLRACREVDDARAGAIRFHGAHDARDARALLRLRFTSPSVERSTRSPEPPKAPRGFLRGRRYGIRRALRAGLWRRGRAPRPPRGGCYICSFHSMSNVLRLILSRPDLNRASACGGRWLTRR